MSHSRSIAGTSGLKRNSQSQKRTIGDTEDSAEVQAKASDLARNVVRYIVIVGGSNIPIKRTDIIKNCFPGRAPSNLTAIIEKAKAILKDVYGYELMDCETKHNKMYVLKNTLKSIEDENLQEIPADSDKVLKFLVLSHIFMSGESSTDAALFAFLQCCKIDPHTLHPIYGNVLDFLNTRMVREKLITIQVNDATRKVNYFWGPNAELTVSKMAILTFFASFGNKNVKSWRVQYENALEQIEDEHVAEDVEEGN